MEYYANTFFAVLITPPKFNVLNNNFSQECYGLEN